MNDWEFRTNLDALNYTAQNNKFLEIWKYEGTTIPLITEGDLDGDNLRQWINSKPPESHRPLLGGLRVIISCSPLGGDNSPFNGTSWKREDFEEILRSFRLPFRYARMLAENDTIFADFHPEDPGGSHGRFAYIFATSAGYIPYWNMAASYDSATSITYAIVRCTDVVREIGETDLLSRFVHSLKEAARFYMHPILPPIAIVDLMTSTNAIDAAKTLGDLSDLEDETGQRFYIREDPRQTDPLALDFASIITRLNRCSTLIRYLEKVAERHTIVLNQMFESISEITDKTIQTCAKTHLRNSSISLNRYAKFLLVSNQNASSRLKYDQLGTQTQLNVVYNFIAQRDNKLNIEVARDSKSIAIASKRDSSSMKTLSVLSMVFLPGTFVTAFFAMPLFNWDSSPGGSIATHHLWIYWAVTVPLTTLVLLIWAVWMHFRIRRHDREDQESQRKTVYGREEVRED